jgi:hypothetical protein
MVWIEGKNGLIVGHSLLRLASLFHAYGLEEEALHTGFARRLMAGGRTHLGELAVKR